MEHLIDNHTVSEISEKGAREDMQHPQPADRVKSIEWAKQVLADPLDYVILDSETTGLEATDEVIQLSLLGLEGTPLLDTYVKPLTRTTISLTAMAIHHISIDMLKDAPSFIDIAPKLNAIISNRTIICYNADYDKRLLLQTARLCRVEFVGGNWHCAMKQYARFRGEWDARKNDYRWPRLPSGDHSALGDCRATLAVIEAMAKG